MGRRGKAAAIGVGLIAVVLLGVVCAGAWRAGQSSAKAASGDDVIELQVDMQCDGWSPVNTELGVFVSGVQLDGAPCDEQLMFEGSGVQVAYLGAGSYEIVPQLPMFMLLDGTVLAVSEPIARDYADEALRSDKAAFVYATVDARDMTENELRETAAGSFADEGDAAEALERALSRRSEGVGYVGA